MVQSSPVKDRQLGQHLVLGPRAPGVTLTQWLYGELRKAILDGRCARGMKLMTTRALATEYGVSRRIVVNVFEQLRDEGYVVSKVGRGTHVSENVPEDVLSPARHSGKRSRGRSAVPLDNDDRVLYRRPARPFRAIEPSLSEFPIELWARVAGRCLRKASTAVLAGGDAAGYRPLREAIASYLGSSRGVVCSADQVIITSGTQQSLDLIARTVLRPGDTVWMEDPGYVGAAEAFRFSGANLAGVRLDEFGFDVDWARSACPHPRAIYVTPAHQFPMGVTMRLDRRLALLRWARTHGVPVIEDDYDSEFRFAGKPVPALKGLQGGADVVLLGTFNKTLFPSLRLGYMVLPDARIEPMLRLRRKTDRYPSRLPELILTEFINEGHFGKHLRRMRELYGSRLAALQDAARKQLTGIVRLPEIQAGLNIPAFLTNGMSSREGAERARERGLEVWPLDDFCLTAPDPKGLLLGFAAFTEREIRQGIQELARALG